MCRDNRRVQKLIRVYPPDQGCTCPVLVQLDNDCTAILKYPHNPQGICVLFNEYISGYLAHAINLTSPNFGLATVDEEVQLGEQMQNADRSIYVGIGFYSEYIPTTVQASPRVLKHAVNLHETSRLVLLDHIVRNTDRYSENLRVETKSAGPRLYAIDHSHAFGDPEWNASKLDLNDIESPYIWRENSSLYTMLINAGGIIDPGSLAVECQYIQSQITYEWLESIFSMVPHEWRGEIGENNISHAKQYIWNRIQNLESICNMIIEERGV